jgi:hypothetical protein
VAGGLALVWLGYGRSGLGIVTVENWDRQKVPKLQLFLLFVKKVSVCVCVRGLQNRKVVRNVLRGRVETENSLNTHISRLCSESSAKT